MSRQRPTSLGSNSQRHARLNAPDGQEIKIPVTRSAATAWYVADADGNWPRRDTLMIDTETNWLREGDVIELVEMRPGEGMGSSEMYQAIEIRNQVRRFEGRYGQIMRLVLLVPVASADSVGEFNAADLEAN